MESVPSQTPAQVARRQADALTAVESAAAEWREAQAAADQLRARLDAAIVEAAASDVPSRIIAESSGFSPQNISLIVAKATERSAGPAPESREVGAATLEDDVATILRREQENKPRRDGTRWELWEDEAIADLYIEFGPTGGTAARREALAARMERTPATVLMRLGNLRAIVEGKGLSSYAKQTLAVAKAKGLV